MKAIRMNNCKGCGFLMLKLENPDEVNSWMWGCLMNNDKAAAKLKGCKEKIFRLPVMEDEDE
jgi:hypothetical protein